MLSEKQLAYLKAQIGHAFDVDKKGNLSFKPMDGIPAFKLIYVEGGEFTMGDGKYDDDPKHDVEVSSFFMAEHQLTQEIYKEVIKAEKEPSRFKGVNHPVEQVSWIDAVAFCNALNKKIGLGDICDTDYNFLNPEGKKTNNITEVVGFRLPTEAEWEYAARGGHSSPPAGKRSGGGQFEYAGSNTLDDVGWYQKNNDYETKPVGLKFPNQLGLYDMSGNVWEWCWDWYDEDFYKNPNKKNPVNIKNGSSRVLRGGSWGNTADYCRMANRYDNTPDDRWYSNGFRLLLALQFTSEPGSQKA